jgi:hypothetical protein
MESPFLGAFPLLNSEECLSIWSMGKMKRIKQKKLDSAGWKVADIADFLGLTKEESALIDMKLSLSKTFCNLIV